MLPLPFAFAMEQGTEVMGGRVLDPPVSGLALSISGTKNGAGIDFGMDSGMDSDAGRDARIPMTWLLFLLLAPTPTPMRTPNIGPRAAKPSAKQQQP
mmetsp:Transcript_17041/g.37257  ORF Transcript_17041/g.37257 Transcript_17041/m.37257 type:complete len:97 (+) Transcript_17041:1526-1816(+)